MEVNLASHTHQTPQVGLPQNDPVTIEIKQKIKPAGAKLFVINGKNFILKTKLIIDINPIVPKHTKAIKEDGT